MEEEIFSTPKDILNFDFRNKLTLGVLTNNFARTFRDGKVIEPKFKLNDFIDIPQSHRLNKEGKRLITCTVGQFIFNDYILTETYLKSYSILTDVINKKVYETIVGNFTELLIQKEISEEDYADFLDRLHWLGNQIVVFSGESFDSESLTISDSLKKYREELFETNKHSLNEPETADMVEKKLIEKLKEETKDKPLGRIIGAGAKGDYNNNYKNLVLTRGIVGGKFIKNNLTEGNDISAYMSLGNNALQGSVGRALKTASGGYLVKLLAKAYSSVSISEPDCGTRDFLRVTITTLKRYNFRLISDRPNPLFFEELNSKNFDKYKGKTVYMYSPLYCRSENGICEKCFGNLWRYNNVRSNMASIIMPVGSQIMGKSMKSFHNLSKDYTRLDFSDEKLFS